jgi:hypothetical protein
MNRIPVRTITIDIAFFGTAGTPRKNGNDENDQEFIHEEFSWRR